MGLYADDYERLGMLAAQAWRAVRLVVDTGLHALGWDRQRAVDLAVGAGLARSTAEVEVDRYISWPGQALAYKTGQVEIERLRAEAAALPGFSLPAWHDSCSSWGPSPCSSSGRRCRSAHRIGPLPSRFPIASH
ncbi:MAG: Prolyl oligopeptidase [Actinobacteria bacterium]|nr:Prolyl oligopeptidase [Actinomycetota bacterium]